MFTNHFLERWREAHLARRTLGNGLARTASSLPGRPMPAWRQMVAGGLYQTRLLRLVQMVSQSYELRSNSRRSLPRWRQVSSPKFAILNYHRVGTAGLPFFSALPPEVFEAQMRFLHRRYRIVSLDELCRELQDPEGTGQAVAITFDDGYRDLYTQAFPILQKYQVPATIFVVVGSIETGEVPWYDRVFLALKVLPGEKLDLLLDRPRRFYLPSPTARLNAAAEIVKCLQTLPDRQRRECCAALEKQVRLPPDESAERMLTWNQIRTMSQAGIAFGSHTMTHPVVSQMPPAEMEREVLESKQIMEQRIGSPVIHFAFPFGQPADCGTEAGAVLARFGYRSAATTSWGINTPGVDPFGLCRVPIGEGHSLAMFALKLNLLFLHIKEEEPG